MCASAINGPLPVCIARMFACQPQIGHEAGTTSPDEVQRATHPLLLPPRAGHCICQRKVAAQALRGRDYNTVRGAGQSESRNEQRSTAVVHLGAPPSCHPTPSLSPHLCQFYKCVRVGAELRGHGPHKLAAADLDHTKTAAQALQ